MVCSIVGQRKSYLQSACSSEMFALHVELVRALKRKLQERDTWYKPTRLLRQGQGLALLGSKIDQTTEGIRLRRRGAKAVRIRRRARL